MSFVSLMPQRRLARPDQRLQGGLELLDIGLRLLVQDDEIDGQPLQAPVLVSAQELSQMVRPGTPAILRE